MSLPPVVFCAGAVVAAVIALLVVVSRDRARIVRDQAAFGTVIHTRSGPVEYAISGQGLPVLIMHGAGGDVRQGVLLAQMVDPAKVQIIGLSRPGYWRTPLSTGVTFEEQAQAAASLLDELKIKKAVVLGVSAGGGAALNFALHQADRCHGLIMLSAYGPGAIRNAPPASMLWLLNMMISADGFMWLMSRLPVQVFLRTQGPLKEGFLADAKAVSLTREIVSGMFPITSWKAGVLNDLQQAPGMVSFPLEQISVPTLFIHGTHDQPLPHPSAVDNSQRIPGAELVTINGGTHFAVTTHWREVGAAIEGFVESLN